MEFEGDELLDSGSVKGGAMDSDELIEALITSRMTATNRALQQSLAQGPAQPMFATSLMRVLTAVPEGTRSIESPYDFRELFGAIAQHGPIADFRISPVSGIIGTSDLSVPNEQRDRDLQNLRMANSRFVRNGQHELVRNNEEYREIERYAPKIREFFMAAYLGTSVLLDDAERKALITFCAWLVSLSTYTLGAMESKKPSSKEKKHSLEDTFVEITQVPRPGCRLSLLAPIILRNVLRLNLTVGDLNHSFTSHVYASMIAAFNVPSYSSQDTKREYPIYYSAPALSRFFAFLTNLIDILSTIREIPDQFLVNIKAAAFAFMTGFNTVDDAFWATYNATEMKTVFESEFLEERKASSPPSAAKPAVESPFSVRNSLIAVKDIWTTLAMVEKEQEDGFWLKLFDCVYILLDEFQQLDPSRGPTAAPPTTPSVSADVSTMAAHIAQLVPSDAQPFPTPVLIKQYLSGLLINLKERFPGDRKTLTALIQKVLTASDDDGERIALSNADIDISLATLDFLLIKAYPAAFRPQITPVVEAFKSLFLVSEDELAETSSTSLIYQLWTHMRRPKEEETKIRLRDVRAFLRYLSSRDMENRLKTTMSDGSDVFESVNRVSEYILHDLRVPVSNAMRLKYRRSFERLPLGAVATSYPQIRDAIVDNIQIFFIDETQEKKDDYAQGLLYSFVQDWTLPNPNSDLMTAVLYDIWKSFDTDKKTYLDKLGSPEVLGYVLGFLRRRIVGANRQPIANPALTKLPDMVKFRATTLARIYGFFLARLQHNTILFTVSGSVQGEGIDRWLRSWIFYLLFAELKLHPKDIESLLAQKHAIDEHADHIQQQLKYLQSAPMNTLYHITADMTADKKQAHANVYTSKLLNAYLFILSQSADVASLPCRQLAIWIRQLTVPAVSPILEEIHPFLADATVGAWIGSNFNGALRNELRMAFDAVFEAVGSVVGEKETAPAPVSRRFGRAAFERQTLWSQLMQVALRMFQAESHDDAPRIGGATSISILTKLGFQHLRAVQIGPKSSVEQLAFNVTSDRAVEQLIKNFATGKITSVFLSSPELRQNIMAMVYALLFEFVHIPSFIPSAILRAKVDRDVKIYGSRDDVSGLEGLNTMIQRYVKLDPSRNYELVFTERVLMAVLLRYEQIYLTEDYLLSRNSSDEWTLRKNNNDDPRFITPGRTKRERPAGRQPIVITVV